ncbi:hypothetical protein P280DRAFT_300116 [Massarina eburnea CBS 473.64]|uniref:Uncharacterized protein n=1 Tax=Massarina eburnea CBS 473.64 TaxID=1395130 RepID=A0A6A6S1S9_9PLEO|nr:hypothetical protein P280DRAFT_300116 [Massarina eburnea CBS 473.64]
MASSADGQSQPRRPAPMTRTHSSNSQVSQSPSESALPKAPKAPRQHVVGQNRMQRNQSSKNLPKISKLTQAQQGEQVKHHRRSQSGNSISTPNSPRPGFKRNASSGGIMRVSNQGNSNIRKNHSSGHLAQKAKQAKPALKTAKSEIAPPPKRSPAHPSKARSPSPEHATVHFDVADEEEEEGLDEGWTEESASQSPNTTRSNTRSNSVILDSQRAGEGAHQKHAEETPQTAPAALQTHAPSSTTLQTLPDRSVTPRPSNGGSSHHSRLPDADMITSRLLQRSSHHNAPPQMSSVAATVVSSHNEVRELSQSGGSTLIDTPGRDLVSRFMDGDGSAGTPNNSSFLPSRGSPQATAVVVVSDADRIKRNKSMPNVAGAETPTKTSRRSGASTPTDLPPSRTQQKLMLQRASSNIEPQKMIPSILPRMGGPTFHTGMSYTTNGEGRIDPRLQQQFNHVAVEYNVVRRYRNPLADAIIRVEQIPGTRRKHGVPRSAGANGYINVHGSSSLSTSFNDETEGRRTRVSFENGGEGDVEGGDSFEGDGGRIRNEAEELCRRLWESIEAVEGD